MEAAEVAGLDLSTRGRPTLGNEAVLGNEAGVRVGFWFPHPWRRRMAEERIHPNHRPQNPAVGNKQRAKMGLGGHMFAHFEIVSSSQVNFLSLYTDKTQVNRLPDSMLGKI